MAGFLGLWDEPDRIDISDMVGAPEGTWWVDVKKCLSRADALEASKIVTDAMRKKGADTVDPAVVARYQEFQVVRSLIAWNLTDAAGDPLPSGTEDELVISLNKLPNKVYRLIADKVVEANSTTSSDAAFPVGSEVGAEDGADEPSDDSEVLV